MRVELRQAFAAGFMVAMLLCSLTGCQQPYLSEPEIRMINERWDYMQGRSQILPPTIVWTRDRNFKISGLTDCTARTITVNARVAESHTHFFLYKVIPHEYAHWASCVNRGNTDGGVPGGEHDDYWRKWVIRLGGDPSYI